MLRGIQNATRNWLGRIVMGLVVGLIGISFAIWGIGDIFRGFGQSTVAVVGGTEIRVEPFRQLYQDRLQQLSRSLGRPILPDQARALGLDRNVLNQMITETLVDERAKALRLGLTDAEVARRITENENFKSITGQFDRFRFDQTLRNMGYNEARFVDEIRRETIRQQLIGTVGGDPAVSKTAVEALNRFRNEQRGIEYFALGPAQAGDIPTPTPEELAKYFEARKVLFRAPEYRKLVTVVLLPEHLAASIEVSDADVKRAYDDRKARYETPERRHVLQIVFPSMEEALTGAEKIAQGTSFTALAEERGLKPSDIDLGTVAKTAMVDRAVGDAAFALKEGEVSKPIEGRFGATLVQALKIEPPKTRPFEEVAEEIRREIATDRARNELIDVQEKIEDERLGGATLSEAARKFGLEARVIEAVDLVADLETPVSAMLKLSAGAVGLLPAGVGRGRRRARPLLDHRHRAGPDLPRHGNKAEINDDPQRTRRLRGRWPSRRWKRCAAHRRIAHRLPDGAAADGGRRVRLSRLRHGPPDGGAAGRPTPTPRHCPTRSLIRPTVIVVFDAVKDEITIVTPVRPTPGVSRPSRRTPAPSTG
jgi:peptidyl-prolyl cis-trans isomerase D